MPTPHFRKIQTRYRITLDSPLEAGTDQEDYFGEITRYTKPPLTQRTLDLRTSFDSSYPMDVGLENLDLTMSTTRQGPEFRAWVGKTVNVTIYESLIDEDVSTDGLDKLYEARNTAKGKVISVTSGEVTQDLTSYPEQTLLIRCTEWKEELAEVVRDQGAGTARRGDFTTYVDINTLTDKRIIGTVNELLGIGTALGLTG